MYDWFEVEDYIQQKYNIDFRDNDDADYWYWLTDSFEIFNDSRVFINLGGSDDGAHKTIKKINKLIIKEFPEFKGGVFVWVSW